MSWLVGWKHRAKLKIPAAEVAAAHVHFPVYINLSSSSGINSDDLTPIFDELLANSLKIAVTTDDGVSQLYVEVVSWDSVTETAELWVSRSTWTMANGADNYLYLYYDHTQVDNSSYVGVPGSTPAEQVWDANYKLVCHMNDNPDTSHVMDSTSNDNDGTKTGANEPIEVAGQIGKAQGYDGVNDAITVGDDASLNPTAALSMSCILNVKSGILANGNVRGIIDKMTYQRWFFRVDKSASGLSFGFTSQHTDGIDNEYSDLASSESGVYYNEDTTYYVTLVFSQALNYKRLYVNGALVREETTTNLGSPFTDFELMTSAEDLLLGSSFEGSFRFAPLNLLDEVQIVADGLSPAWVGASYETLRDHFWQLDTLENYPYPEPVIGWTIPKRRPLPKKINVLLAEAIRDYLEMKLRAVGD